MLLIISNFIEKRLYIDKYFHVSNLFKAACLVSFQEALCQGKIGSSNFFFEVTVKCLLQASIWVTKASVHFMQFGN